LLQGIGSAAYVTAALAAFADIGTPETRIGDMSNYQAATLIGLSVGPGIGGLLAATVGYESPFLLLGGMAVLGTLAIALAVVPEKDKAPPIKDGASARGREPVPAGLAASVVGLVAMTFGVVFTRIGVVWVLLPLFAQARFALGPREIGLMLTASAVGNLVMLPLVTILARRQGYRFTVLLSTWVMVGALILLAVLDAVASVWLAAVLLGIGSALALPTLSAYAANAAPPHQLGAAMGLLRTVTDVAIVIGPVAVGALLSSAGLGYVGVLVICAAILFITTIVFAILIRPAQA
jgi:MFS family permease